MIAILQIIVEDNIKRSLLKYIVFYIANSYQFICKDKLFITNRKMKKQEINIIP